MSTVRSRALMCCWALMLPWAAHAGEPWREPVTGMEFSSIPKGCYSMGLPADVFREEDQLFRQRLKAEMPQHEVCVDAFWMGQYEVRESEWAKLMGKPHSGRPAEAPVAGVAWAEASEFARRLTEASNGAQHYRLPTEAEWEYACRAGSPALTSIFSRNNLASVAWYATAEGLGFSGNRLKDVQPVGLKQPNQYGLYDMLGNVWEWVQDAYSAKAYTSHALYNPVHKESSVGHVIRGGALRTDKRIVRCEARSWFDGEPVHDTLGFRLVRDR